MTGKKELLANFLFSNSAVTNLRMLWPHPNLSILAYHRVVPLPDSRYPYVKGVISCDTETFDRQLGFVRKHFDVLNFRDIREIHLAGEEIPPNSLVLTFDDGYADNYLNMLPVLESHDMTAVVFLATHYVDSGELFWVDKLAYTVNRMRPQTLVFLDGKHRFEVRDETREQVRRELGRLCASVSFSDHLRILGELEAQAGQSPGKDDYELARPLTWAEVVELERAGVEIGGHTVTHGFLDRMTSDEIETELRDSKHAIDRHLENNAITVCYPAGKYTDEVLRIAASCGYEYGCSYRHGSARYTPGIRFEIPRIHVDYDVTLPLFKANLTLPGVFLT